MKLRINLIVRIVKTPQVPQLREIKVETLQVVVMETSRPTTNE